MRLILPLLIFVLLSAWAIAAEPDLRLDIERASIEERLDWSAPHSPLAERIVARDGMRFLCVFVQMSAQWHDDRESLAIPAGEVLIRWEGGQDSPVGRLDRGLHLVEGELKPAVWIGRPAVFQRRRIDGWWDPQTTWRLQVVFSVPEDAVRFDLQVGAARIEFEAEPGQLPDVADQATFAVAEPVRGDFHDAPWEVQGQTLRGRLTPIQGGGKLVAPWVAVTPRMANGDYVDAFLLDVTDLALLTEDGAVCPPVAGVTPSLRLQKKDGEWQSHRQRYLFTVPDGARVLRLLYHGRVVAAFELPAEDEPGKEKDGGEEDGE